MRLFNPHYQTAHHPCSLHHSCMQVVNSITVWPSQLVLKNDTNKAHVICYADCPAFLKRRTVRPCLAYNRATVRGGVDRFFFVHKCFNGGI